MKKREIEQLLQNHIRFEPITEPHFDLDLAPLSKAPVLSPWRRIIVAVFSFFLLAISGVYFNLRYQVESTISVDFNPSFDLQLNYFGEVIGFVAQNNDALALMDSLPKHPLSPEQALAQIYQYSIEEGIIASQQSQVFLIGFHQASPTQSQKFISALESSAPASIYFLFINESNQIASNRFFQVSTLVPSQTTNESVDALFPSGSDSPSSELDRHNLLAKPLRQLTQAERVVLAETLEISYAKLSLIIQILIFENKTEDLTLFFQYVRSDINTLALRLPR